MMSLIQEALKRQQEEDRKPGAEKTAEQPAPPPKQSGNEPPPVPPGSDDSAASEEEPTPQPGPKPEPSGQRRIVIIAVAAAAAILGAGGLTYGIFFMTGDSAGNAKVEPAARDTLPPDEPDAVATDQQPASEIQETVELQPDNEPALPPPEEQATEPEQEDSRTEAVADLPPTRDTVMEKARAKKDETKPAEEKPRTLQPVIWPELTVQGLLSRGGEGAAILNSEVISIGESLKGVELIKIMDNSVVLQFKGRTKELKVGEMTTR